MDEQRLIDANALYKDMDKKLALKPGMKGTMYEFMRFVALDCVETAPTIDAKPVVHAHWIGSDGTHCSHCERSYMDVADADSWESDDIPDFCPYCGAQMDEEEG